jgi:hypothetical protein
MAELDNFTLFLVGGIGFILVVMLIFVGLDASSVGGILTPDTRTVISSTDKSFPVGPENVEAFVPYHLNFNVSNTAGEKTYDLGNEKIFSGILFGSNSLKYHTTATSPDFLRISFSVEDTNSYAPLTVKVNNKEVKKSVFTRGDYTFDVDKSFLSDEMDVEIIADSSTWKFWAPTVYELGSIKLETESFNEKSYVFNFDLADKFSTFKSGRMNMNLHENKGKITVTINGNKLFDDIPSDFQNIEFFKEKIVNGTNSIEMRASEGGEFVGNAVLAVKYTSTHENKVFQTFDVTNNTYNNFLGGELSFVVSDVEFR